MEITYLKIDIRWDGVLPFPNHHRNKRHDTENPTQNGPAWIFDKSVIEC